MATSDKILNGAGLSALSSQIKSYVNDKTEISVGETAPTDTKIKLWVDTSSEGSIEWDDIANKPDIPSIEGLAKTADLAKVATSGSYNDLSDKPESYTLPVATSSTLGGVKVDGSTITITEDGVISSTGSSGGSEPDKYIKDASVSGNTLTLTKEDDSTITFSPTGGSSGGSSGYAFSSSETFTDEDKAHLKEVITGNNVYMTIDKLTVIRVLNIGNNRGFAVINLNGGTDNVVKVYTITCDSNLDVISSKFTLFTSYALLGSSNQYAAAITSDNINDYVSSSWSTASDLSDSNLYNAKELLIDFVGDSTEHTIFYNAFGDNNLGNETNTVYLIPTSSSISSGYFVYNGSSIELSNTSNWSISCIYYKT